MTMSVCVSTVIVALLLIFGRFIAGAFTETQEVIDMTMRMLWILALGYMTFSVANVLWGVVRGAGDAISPLWASVFNSVIIRLPTAYLFVYLLARPEALMFSLATAWTANMVLAIIVFRIGKWRTKGLVQRVESKS